MLRNASPYPLCAVRIQRKSAELYGFDNTFSILDKEAGNTPGEGPRLAQFRIPSCLAK